MSAKRTPVAESYPPIRAMRDQGWSVAKIARHVHKHPRTVDYILAQGAKLPQGTTGTLAFVPDPIPREKLDPEVRVLLEDTPDAFETFFNRYSQWTLAPHSKRFVEAAWDEEAVLLNVSVRHAKTEVFAVWLPIWHICRNRDVQILLLSNTRDQALKPFRDIENHLRTNPKLIKDFGRFMPEANNQTWSSSTGALMVEGRNRTALSGDLTLLTRGAKSGIYGFAADLIIADDVVDEENIATPDRRDKLSHWFHQIVETRLQPEGRIIVIGSRFHEDDLYGHLSRLSDYPGPDDDEGPGRLWNHINFPAVLDFSTEEVLWPEVWPFKKLMRKRQFLGTKVFDQAYQQNPIPSDERTVQPEWLDQCWDVDRVWGPQKLRGTRVVSLDPSPTRFAGIVVADVWGDRKNFLCDVLEVSRAKMDVRKMMAELARISKAYHPSTLVIEVNAAQRWFLQDVEFEQWRRSESIRVIPHTTSRNKADEVMGVKSLGGDFEFARIRLPGGDRSSKEAMTPLIEEVLAHPYGRTDDVMMALWFIKWNHQRLYRPKSTKPVEGRRFHMPRRLAGTFAWMGQPA